MVQAILSLCLAALAGCGDDSTPVDAGPDAVADSAAPDAGLVLPEVALPEMGACAPGWREVTDGEAVYCDPWPDTGIAACAGDEAHVPGEPGCARVGTECPAAGDFAPDLPAGTIVYVRDGEPPGGDGSSTRPYDTLAAGLAAAGDGDVVALAAGTYDGPVTIPAGVTVWGACMDTVIATDMTAPGIEGVVEPGGDTAALRNLRVTGERTGIHVPAGRALDVTDVIVSGTLGVGVGVSGMLAARGLVVRGVRHETDPDGGYGILVEPAATARIERSVVEDLGLGMQVRGEATLDTVAVHEARSGGVLVSFGGSTDIAGLAADDNGIFGVEALEFGTSVHIVDSLIRGTEALGEDRPGELRSGPALVASTSAQIDAERVALLENTTVAAYTRFRISSIHLTDVVIQDTRPSPGGVAGLAMLAEEFSDITASRLLAQRNHHFAVLVQADGVMDLSDVTVTDTREIPSMGLEGRALQVLTGSITLRRGRIERSHDTAVGVRGGNLTLEGVRISDTLAEEGGARFGYGIVASQGGTAMVTDTVVERSIGVGVAAFGDGTQLTGVRVAVTDTAERECGGTPCDGYGYGLSSLDGAAMDLTGFEIASAAQVGAQLEGGGTVDLHGGSVSDTPVGFNIQTTGFDESRLRDGVVLTGVATEVDLSALPLPFAMPPIDI